jgi:hypothetical protein
MIKSSLVSGRRGYFFLQEPLAFVLFSNILVYMTTYIIAHKMKFSTKSVMPACPASFLEERFPASGNDKACGKTYDAMCK